MPTLQVKDATNATQTINTMNNNGQANMANSQSVTVASDQSAIPVTPGVQFGSGVVTGTTQRVTLATDGPTVSTLTSIDNKTPSLGQAAMAASQPVVIASNQSAVPVTQLADAIASAPGYDPAGSPGNISVDPFGNLAARAQVLTDEGGYRCGFANSSLAVSIGSCTFVNGSKNVTGTGFANADLHAGSYVKLDSDAEANWTQIYEVLSDTQLTLVANYPGSSATGAASRALMRPVTGAGASITVASSQCTIAAGTTAGSLSEVERDVDWLPIVKQAGVAVSQRIVNQSIYIGFYDEAHPLTPYYFAWFLLDGTTNTTVKCQSARNPTGAPSAAETEETAVTLPAGVTTAASLRYRIEVLTDRVVFFINGVVVATHLRAGPGLGDFMTSTVRVVNGGSAPASNTNIVIDYDSVKNHNRLEVGPFGDNDVVVASNAINDVFTYNQSGVITINTDLLFVDCSRYRTLIVQCISMGTSGVVTPSFSSDNGTTFATAATLIPATGGTAVVTTFNAAGTWVVPVTGNLARIRLTTATTAGTTTLRVVGCQQVLNIPVSTITVAQATAANLSATVVQSTAANLNATVTATNLSCNINQFAGATPVNPATNGATNRSLVSAIAGPTSNTDYSAQAWAAASGSGAVIAQANGLGAATAFDVNLTAWTAGSSTGLDIYLQESPDNGTTYYDIWQCEALTAVSRARIPCIPVGGRRRMRWVNRGGAATTATVTVTAMESSVAWVKQVQWFDRTASVTSGTAGLGNGAAFDIAACKALTFTISTGTATGAASWKVQMSMNGTDWYDASAATSCPASSITVIPLTAGVYGRFGRFVCTVAGTSALVNYGSCYGTN
jgi:hypothetical protein